MEKFNLTYFQPRFSTLMPEKDSFTKYLQNFKYLEICTIFKISIFFHIRHFLLSMEESRMNACGLFGKTHKTSLRGLQVFFPSPFLLCPFSDKNKRSKKLLSPLKKKIKCILIPSSSNPLNLHRRKNMWKNKGLTTLKKNIKNQRSYYIFS